MYAREVARRVFIEELRRSDLSFREGNEYQYAPQYILTPTGARCNRVFLVGTLIERDDIGEDAEYWRGRIADPTGSILIYAGQYQPDASRALAEIDIPAFVAVVGKPSIYETEDGRKITSVRAESIQRVDLETRNKWILETAKRTIERLELIKNIDVPQSTEFQQGALYQPESPTTEDCRRAKSHYLTDPEEYRQMVINALRSLQADVVSAQDVPQESYVDIPVNASDTPGDDLIELHEELEVYEKKTDDYEYPPLRETADLQKKTDTKSVKTNEIETSRKQTRAKRISSLADLQNNDIDEIDI